MAKWRDVKQKRVDKTLLEKNSPKANSTNLASVAQRFKAFLTDSFLVTTPIMYIVIYLIMGGGEGFSLNRSLGWSIILFATFVIIGIFWLKNGQTPGLKAYDIKLVDAKTEDRISVFQAFIRFFSTLFAIILFAPMFFVFFNKNKRTFQDIVSNTKIIIEK
ncbi:RDD family protein [Arcobacter porcinus]|uniref:RDD family membrane protein n=1 Tax=Arcobacter porcinus TaxID=1935204 RepID=A0A1C0AXK7_9BACT|nr:RDD family protein [Arcobacter porcinus]OCL97416.1 RDD family protein [Aliarcobacter thereius]OCL84329.1 RDD family protein [Arcobacter porcinus]OCL89386.1 RDD family protein [Arcobacter porcinus]OCL91805.1 RDD family protein [Arcobacter porcinus]QEP41576.1 RDD family membrane protein [Arcobacter porcinus]